MAFSLACDASKTTLRIEGEDNNVTWNDVTNAGAGSVAVDGGGTEDPSFFVTEHVANAMYQILKNIQFGDGTNALTFYSKNETVYFDDDKTFELKSNVTLQLGEKIDDWGVDGAYWRFNFGPSGYYYIIPDGLSNVNLRIYASTLFSAGAKSCCMSNSTRELLNSILMTNQSDFYFYFWNAHDSVIIKRVYVAKGLNLGFYNSPTTLEDVHIHNTIYGIMFGFGSTTLKNLRITSHDSTQIRQSGGSGITGNIVNPFDNIISVMIGDATSVIKEQYTCDIHVVDKDGSNLEGVTVVCEDKDSNQVFSVQTGADGKIVQQIVTYKKWQGTGETETEYSPHKFTFSKNGYTLLVMENVTVDTRINWGIEVKFPERIRARMANLSRLAILR